MAKTKTADAADVFLVEIELLMNRYEEEIVTAQYAEEPNDQMPPHNADSNSGGLSLGCILSIVAGVFFCLLLLAAAIGFSYFVWSSKKQNQIAIADEPTIMVTSLDKNSLAEAVEVFDGAGRAKKADIESHLDFRGIDLLFQKLSKAGDVDDMEAVYPYFDFKRHAKDVAAVSETKSFFRQYTQREIEDSVRDFGVYIRPFGKWEIVKIQQLSSNERLVYAQVQSYGDVERCRVWVTKNRFAGWKVYDWEGVSDLCRASTEAAWLIAEPNANYSNAFNKYYELIETDLTQTDSDAEYARILKKCEGLRLNPKIRPSILLNVAEYWLSFGKPKEALRCASKIQNKDLIPEAYRLEGNAYKELEDYEAAVESYELFVEHVGGHSDVLQSLVDSFEELGDEKQQQAYQLERFKAWPASSCYFEVGEVLAFYKDEPEKLFNAIARSSQSEEIYRKCFDQLSGNPFALPELRLVKEQFDRSGLQEPLLGQRAAAWLAMAEGNYDEFQRLMVGIFEQDSETDDNDKWIEAVEYRYHHKLFEAAEDKTAAFEALVKVYLYNDWYSSEADFESICATAFELMPENESAIYFKAFQFFEAGEFDKAMSLFETIDGKMNGDFEYLNNLITKRRLASLLNQKQFGKALDLAKQNDSVEQLLEISIEQDSPEMFDRISDKDLKKPAGLLLKAVRALEKNQNKSAAKHFSDYLKEDETSYGLANIAVASLVKVQPQTSGVVILQENSSYSVYRYLAGILEKNRDWPALETLSKAALKLLKSEFKESTYAKRYVLENLNEAQWRQQKYGSILKRYQKLGDKQEVDGIRTVLLAACKEKDFQLARRICEESSASLGDEALVAAFEGDMQAFSAAVKEVTPYRRTVLGETLIELGVDDRFRRWLWQGAEAVNIEYGNNNLETIDVVFPAKWTLTDVQFQSVLAELSKVASQRFELITAPNTGQIKRWLAKSSSCGVMIEAKQLNGSKFSGFAGSAAKRRIKNTLSSNHQQVTVSVFPITGKPKFDQSTTPVRVDYGQLAASLLVAIADQSPLALKSVGAWSDDQAVFERVKALAEGKAYKKLVSIDTFYGYELDASEEDGFVEKLRFQKKLANVFQQFQSSSESNKDLSATVEYDDVSVEIIQVKLDEAFKLGSYNQGATFTGIVTKQSEPFGIFKTGDRLEFTDDEIKRWKLELADEVQTGQRPE